MFLPMFHSRSLEMKRFYFLLLSNVPLVQTEVKTGFSGAFACFFVSLSSFAAPQGTRVSAALLLLLCSQTTFHQ